jgi:hypothetical protein
LKVCCVGDFAGAVFDLALGLFETNGEGARNTGVPARNTGVARPVAGNNDSRADGGFDTVGEVARLCSLGSGRLSSLSLIEMLSNGLVFSLSAFSCLRA